MSGNQTPPKNEDRDRAAGKNHDPKASGEGEEGEYQSPVLTFVGSLAQLVLKTGATTDNPQPHTLRP